MRIKILPIDTVPKVDEWNAALDEAAKVIEDSWKNKAAMGYTSTAQRNLVYQHINLIRKLKHG